MLDLRGTYARARSSLMLVLCAVLLSCGGDDDDTLSSYKIYPSGASFGSEELVFVQQGGRLVVDGVPLDVAAFYIAKHETTSSQYGRFMRAGDGFDNAGWWAGVPAADSPPERPWDRPQPVPIYRGPRDHVTWYMAVAYTRWLNARMQAENADISEGGLLVNGEPWELRLPTEWEWQWAAQAGAEAREYPWGDWRPSHANTLEANRGGMKAVGSYPRGEGAFGTLDMSGNLAEWCLNKWREPHATEVDGSNAARAIRGGSYRDRGEQASTSSRAGHFARRGGHHIGFRVGVFPPQQL